MGSNKAKRKRAARKRGRVSVGGRRGASALFTVTNENGYLAEATPRPAHYVPDTRQREILLERVLAASMYLQAVAVAVFVILAVFTTLQTAVVWAFWVAIAGFTLLIAACIGLRAYRQLDDVLSVGAVVAAPSVGFGLAAIWGPWLLLAAIVPVVFGTVWATRHPV